jgi:energy-coupling factor transporter ATP-binding protein EcfA2
LSLISEVEIKGFRSIRHCKLESLGDFTVFAGLNNSGKSNFLRALNAFFNDQTDPERWIDVDNDYFRPDLRKKKKRQISISVNFSLPDRFKFRKGLDAAQRLLGGNEFTISKTWNRKDTLPSYQLNGEKLGLEDQQKIGQFIQLISFRYIPNRVHPIEVIQNEHRAIRDVLVRRLGKRAGEQQVTFSAIRETSENMIKGLVKHLIEASPDVKNVRLATPTSWADMVFGFGYKLGENGLEVDDSVQGSGIQSLLMLETLYLIDRDYFQKFGWKQAAIWAVEEPESSLHTSLEALVASYLASIVTDPKSRLQVLSTTHSDLILQHASKVIFVKKNGWETVSEPIENLFEGLERLSREGISRWAHPILHFPLDPLILVEGKYDADFLEEAVRYIRPKRKIRVSYLERLEGGGRTGGVDDLLDYVKNNLKAIRSRRQDAPVIIVLDWDSAKKTKQFQKLFGTGDPFKVLAWPNRSFNPKLGKTFHGVERYFSDRMIQEVEDRGGQIYRNRKGICSVQSEEYGEIKNMLNGIVNEGLKEEDIVHARDFIREILRAAVAQQ